MLSSEGLSLRTGPFVMNVQSPLRRVHEGVSLLYSDFPLADADEFIDFRVSVEPSSGVRRWVRRQAIFSFDGRIPFKPLPEEQALPMLEWGMNWVLSGNAQTYLVLHAAVVERGGRALIMAAPPGSGKSTLCAALVHAGWRLLSDELALVSLGDGLIAPVARPISLKNRSIEIVRGFGADVIVGPACVDTSKGTVAHMKPPEESVLRCLESADPAWIVFPQYGADLPFQLSPMRKASAFMELLKNAFNDALLAEDGFDALVRLVDRCRIYRVQYSHLDQVVPELERLPLP